MPIGALEPYDTIFTIFAALTPAEQREMLELALALDASVRRSFATHAGQLFRGGCPDDLGILALADDLQIARHDARTRVDADYRRDEEASLMTSRNRAGSR